MKCRNIIINSLTVPRALRRPKGNSVVLHAQRTQSSVKSARASNTIFDARAGLSRRYGN